MTATKDNLSENSLTENSLTDHAEPQIVTLPGEDGDIDCEILLTFNYGGRDIIALIPIAPNDCAAEGGSRNGDAHHGDGGAGEPSVLLFGYSATELEDGDVSLQFTEIPDREYDGVLRKFESVLAGTD